VTSESEGSFPPIGSILDAKFKWNELEDRLHSKLVPAEGEEMDSAKLQNSLDARLMKLRAEMALPADRTGKFAPHAAAPATILEESGEASAQYEVDGESYSQQNDEAEAEDWSDEERESDERLFGQKEQDDREAEERWSDSEADRQQRETARVAAEALARIPPKPAKRNEAVVKGKQSTVLFFDEKEATLSSTAVDGASHFYRGRFKLWVRVHQVRAISTLAHLEDRPFIYVRVMLSKQTAVTRQKVWERAGDDYAQKLSLRPNEIGTLGIDESFEFDVATGLAFLTVDVRECVPCWHDVSLGFAVIPVRNHPPMKESQTAWHKLLPAGAAVALSQQNIALLSQAAVQISLLSIASETDPLSVIPKAELEKVGLGSEPLHQQSADGRKPGVANDEDISHGKGLQAAVGKFAIANVRQALRQLMCLTISAKQAKDLGIWKGAAASHESVVLQLVWSIGARTFVGKHTTVSMADLKEGMIDENGKKAALLSLNEVVELYVKENDLQGFLIVQCWQHYEKPPGITARQSYAPGITSHCIGSFMVALAHLFDGAPHKRWYALKEGVQVSPSSLQHDPREFAPDGSGCGLIEMEMQAFNVDIPTELSIADWFLNERCFANFWLRPPVAMSTKEVQRHGMYRLSAGILIAQDILAFMPTQEERHSVFFTIHYASMSFRTSSVVRFEEGTNLLAFKEATSFPFPNPADDRQPLVVRCWLHTDQASIKEVALKYLGEVTISVDLLHIDFEESDIWFILTNAQTGHVAGRVKLRMSIKSVDKMGEAMSVRCQKLIATTTRQLQALVFRDKLPACLSADSYLLGGKPATSEKPRYMMVTIAAADGLAASDVLTRSSDPYCRVVHGGDADDPRCTQTRVAWKTRHPSWNESFVAQLGGAAAGVEAPLILECSGHDALAGDELIGGLAIKLQRIEFSANIVHREWCALRRRDKEGRTCGRLLLFIRELSEETVRASVVMAESKAKLNFHLLVDVVKCRGLRASPHSGSVDPYVIVSFMKQEFRSKVISQNLNPTFNELFQFKSLDHKCRDEVVRVAVWDHDVFSHDNILGQCHIDLQHFFLGERESKWHTLFDEDGSAVAEVFLGIEISQDTSTVADEAGKAAAREWSAATSQTWEHLHGYVSFDCEVTIHEGRGLDENMRHVVSVSIGSGEELAPRKTTASEKSATPVWDQKFELPLEANMREQDILIEVRDLKMFGKEQLVGYGRLWLFELQDLEELKREWVKLVDDEGRAAGQVCVSVLFRPNQPSLLQATTTRKRSSDALGTSSKLVSAPRNPPLPISALPQGGGVVTEMGLSPHRSLFSQLRGVQNVCLIMWTVAGVDLPSTTGDPLDVFVMARIGRLMGNSGRGFLRGGKLSWLQPFVFELPVSALADAEVKLHMFCGDEYEHEEVATATVSLVEALKGCVEEQASGWCRLHFKQYVFDKNKRERLVPQVYCVYHMLKVDGAVSSDPIPKQLEEFASQFYRVQVRLLRAYLAESSAHEDGCVQVWVEDGRGLVRQSTLLVSTDNSWGGRAPIGSDDGSADMRPYIEVVLTSADVSLRRRTKLCSIVDAVPRWREKLDMTVDAEPGSIVVRCLEEDVDASDILVGEVEISLQSWIFAGEPLFGRDTTRWFPLIRNGDVVGEVSLKILVDLKQGSRPEGFDVGEPLLGDEFSVEDSAAVAKPVHDAQQGLKLLGLDKVADPTELESHVKPNEETGLFGHSLRADAHQDLKLALTRASPVDTIVASVRKHKEEQFLDKIAALRASRKAEQVDDIEHDDPPPPRVVIIGNYAECELERAELVQAVLPSLASFLSLSLLFPPFAARPSRASLASFPSLGASLGPSLGASLGPSFFFCGLGSCSGSVGSEGGEGERGGLGRLYLALAV
jgi:hypothetical protein